MPRRCLAFAFVAVVAALVMAPAAASAESCTADTPSLMLNQSVEIAYDCPVTGTPTLGARPWFGTVEVLSGPGERPVRVRYTPDLDAKGVDRFTWSDGEGTVAEQYVVVGSTLRLACEAVTRVSKAPPPIVARDGQEQAIEIRCANRVYGDALTVEVTSPPAHGTVSVAADQYGDFLRYLPQPGYAGPDSVSVRVRSPVPGRSTDSFAIPIAVQPANRAPVCAPVALTVVPVDGHHLFANLCSDPDGDPLSYGVVSMPQSGQAFFGPDNVLNYHPRRGWSGRDTIRVVVGDGFAVSSLDIPVEVRAEAPPPPSPPPPVPPPPAPPPVRLPAPPEGFVPARGADVGADAAVWGPLGGIRLGRRALPVIAVGCRVACTVEAQLRLYPPRRRSPVALPAQTLRLAAGRREVLRMRLTGAARTAVRDRRRVRAVLSLVVHPAGGAPLRDALELRVALPAAKAVRREVARPTGRSPGRSSSPAAPR